MAPIAYCFCSEAKLHRNAEQLADWCEQQLLLLAARDVETAHVEADKMVVLFLREAGFERVAIAFERLEKWYA